MEQQRLNGVAILLVILLNYPILSLFNLDYFVLGVPLIYVYVFATWSIAIILVAFITEYQKLKDSADNE